MTTNLRVRTVPRFCELNTGICLTTEEKARKNLSQGSQRMLFPITNTPTQFTTPTKHTPSLLQKAPLIHTVQKPTHTHTHTLQTYKTTTVHF